MTPELPAIYRLGIVGAGQIARMTHQAAVKLGITPRLLAEEYDDSAALAAPAPVYSQPDSMAAFVESCEVVTFEHERLDLGLLSRLEDAGHKIRPGSKAIRAAFDKLHQRRLLQNRGFLVPNFAEIKGPDDLFDFASTNDWPIVIKSVREGLPDERNIWVVATPDEGLRVLSENGHRQLMAENYQAIIKELVVLVVRRPGGTTRCYPVAEVIQADGACQEVRAPAAIGPRVASEAKDLATRLANELEAVGVLAVEIFLTTEGLVVNEVAARPHNAGHLTIEGAPTSQFENHVRAVLDLPLGPTWALAPAVVTVNVIGGYDGVDPVNHLADALVIEGTHIHLYEKRPRPGRKLGHVTAIGDDLEQARDLARRAEAALLGRRPW